MTFNTEQEQQLAEHLDAYLTYLDGEANTAPRLEQLSEDLQDEARARVNTLRALRGMPPAADRTSFNLVAARFGFDRDAVVHVDGPKIARLRKRAGLDLLGLSAALNQAGVPQSIRELSGLELADNYPVPKRLATVLVAILGSPLLTFEASSEMSEALAWLYSPEFDAMVAEWCQEHSRESAETADFVRSRVLSGAYRADDVTAEQIRDMVLAVLRSLDQ
ncbi:MAG: hypothetical protein ACK5CE_04125 [Actinomycetes bacterium]